MHTRAHHHAPGKLYLFALALAVFGAMSRCSPDLAPEPAFGAEADIGFRICKPPRAPTFDENGFYLGCILPPAAPPAEHGDNASGS